jgi:cation transport regulator ChaC
MAPFVQSRYIQKTNGQVLDLAAGVFTTGMVYRVYQLRPAPAAMA